MILTNCAACAAPLAHNAPRCVRCHTRYCNKTCQHDHWRRGHKQICKRIHRGGNAEQYHADKKYKEAVAVAVEACADNAEITLRLRWGYASVLLHDDPSSEEDTREAVRVLEDVVRRVTQGYGEAHPLRKWTGETLVGARKNLALIEASK